MNGMHKFFYRIDIVRRICFFLAIPCGVFCVIYPRGRLILFILAVAGLIFGIIPLGMPTEEEIMRHISELHAAYAAQVMRERHEEPDLSRVLDGFSEEQSYLCRYISVRAIYPVCRTVVMREEEGTLVLSVKDTPLLKNHLPEEGELRFAKAYVSFQRVKRAVKIVFTANGEDMTILLPNKFKLHELLPRYRAYLDYDEEAWAKL